MFSFSNFANNLRGGANALQSMPMSDKLMASGQLLKGQQPDWLTLMGQLGGGHSPTTPGPMVAVPGQGSPFAAAKAQDGPPPAPPTPPTPAPPQDAAPAEQNPLDAILSGKYGLLGLLGGGMGNNPLGMLGSLGGGKGGGFGFGGGGLASLLGGK